MVSTPRTAMFINSPKQNTGFTLIEVLVALAIIATSIGAILSSSGSQAEQTLYLKQKTVAHWVALNEITQLQINKTWPELGKFDGDTSMANNEWYWIRTVQKTEDENSREVEFEVFSDKERLKNITKLTAFIIK